MLGIQYIKGKVIMGNQKGKDFGFPTANIIITKKEFKDSNATTGVFIVKVKIDNEYRLYNGSGCISKLEEGRYLIETHLIDYDSSSPDFYQREMKISFLKKIRENITFASTRELFKQIDIDTSKVLEHSKSRRTCENCQLCFRQDEGYSNYTVTDSYLGCFVDNFNDIDTSSTDLEWESNKHIYAESCSAYEEGEMWYLDVDREEPRPSDEQIAIWKRNAKINLIIE